MCNDTAQDMIPNTYCNDLRPSSTGTDRYNQHKNNSTLLLGKHLVVRDSNQSSGLQYEECKQKDSMHSSYCMTDHLADHFVMAGKGTEPVTQAKRGGSDKVNEIFQKKPVPLYSPE